MKKALYILVFLFTAAIAAQPSMDKLLKQYNTRSIPYISVEMLRSRQVQDSVLILDTREIEEYTVSHIPSAILIGYSQFNAEEISEMIPNKNIPIVIYCSVGIRSEEIGEKLKKAGYNNLYNLYGGIFAWKNKGYTVVDMNNSETEKVHVFSEYWGQWLQNGKKIY